VEKPLAGRMHEPKISRRSPNTSEPDMRVLAHPILVLTRRGASAVSVAISERARVTSDEPTDA